MNYNPERSVNRLTYFLVGSVIVIIVVFIAKTGSHRNWAPSIETDMVLDAWEGREHVDTLTEYALLPSYDRYLIDKHCQHVFDRIQKFRGTKERIHHSLEPICQALIAGGWQPNWTVEKYFKWLKNR